MPPSRAITDLDAAFEIVLLVQDEERILCCVALSQGISHHELCLAHKLWLILGLLLVNLV